MVRDSATRASSTAIEREVRVRVRNHLQLLDSLVRLRAEGATPDARAALDDCARRIGAMALVDEHLEATGGGRVDLAPYLDDVVRSLHRREADRRVLARDLSLDPVAVGVETATYLGVIASELVSNAIRHAWPSAEPGRLHVALNAGATNVRLLVRDDGIGIPAASLAGTKGLGLRLVHGLVERLQGRVVIDGSRGTSVRVTIARRHP